MADLQVTDGHLDHALAALAATGSRDDVLSAVDSYLSLGGTRTAAVLMFRPDLPTAARVDAARAWVHDPGRERFAAAFALMPGSWFPDDQPGLGHLPAAAQRALAEAVAGVLLPTPHAGDSATVEVQKICDVLHELGDADAAEYLIDGLNAAVAEIATSTDTDRVCVVATAARYILGMPPDRVLAPILATRGLFEAIHGLHAAPTVAAREAAKDLTVLYTTHDPERVRRLLLDNGPSFLGDRLAEAEKLWTPELVQALVREILTAVELGGDATPAFRLAHQVRALLNVDQLREVMSAGLRHRGLPREVRTWLRQVCRNMGALAELMATDPDQVAAALGSWAGGDEVTVLLHRTDVPAWVRATWYWESLPVLDWRDGVPWDDELMAWVVAVSSSDDHVFTCRSASAFLQLAPGVLNTPGPGPSTWDAPGVLLGEAANAVAVEVARTGRVPERAWLEALPVVSLLALAGRSGRVAAVVGDVLGEVLGDPVHAAAFARVVNGAGAEPFGGCLAVVAAATSPHPAVV